jgi:hypothetical protein
MLLVVAAAKQQRWPQESCAKVHPQRPPPLLLQQQLLRLQRPPRPLKSRPRAPCVWRSSSNCPRRCVCRRVCACMFTFSASHRPRLAERLARVVQTNPSWRVRVHAVARTFSCVFAFACASVPRMDAQTIKSAAARSGVARVGQVARQTVGAAVLSFMADLLREAARLKAPSGGERNNAASGGVVRNAFKVQA